MSAIDNAGMAAGAATLLLVNRKELSSAFRYWSYVAMSYIPVAMKPRWVRLIEVKYFHRMRLSMGDSFDFVYRMTKLDAHLWLSLK